MGVQETSQGIVAHPLNQGRAADGTGKAGTNCNDIIAQEISNLTSSIKQAEAKITYDQLPTLKTNGGLLGQVLRNLIGNAIKFRGDEAPQVRHTTNDRTKTSAKHRRGLCFSYSAII